MINDLLLLWNRRVRKLIYFIVKSCLNMKFLMAKTRHKWASNKLKKQNLKKKNPQNMPFILLYTAKNIHQGIWTAMSYSKQHGLPSDKEKLAAK